MLMHKDAEVVFFLGDGCEEFEALSLEFSDKMYIAVRGNCDHTSVFRSADLLKTEQITLEGHRILATHGDLFSAKYGTAELSRAAKERGCEIVLFGHTHTPCDMYVPGERAHYLFNPGSIREGSFGILMLSNYVLFSVGMLR
jgi:putative phosphoesterase